MISLDTSTGCDIAQVVGPWLPTMVARVQSHVGFVVDEVTLGQVFCFPCQFPFHRLLYTHHHLSSGAGTIGQIVADMPSGLTLTPCQEIIITIIIIIIMNNNSNCVYTSKYNYIISNIKLISKIIKAIRNKY
jgi:hypothetical protein